jgi:hypothetical protein
VGHVARMGGNGLCITIFGRKDLKESGHLHDLGIDGMIMF